MDLVEASASRAISGLLDGDAADRIRAIYDQGTPENTRIAYRRDLAYAKAWCECRGVAGPVPMAADVATLFVVDHVTGLPDAVDEALVAAGAKRDFGPHAITTVRRRISTLKVAHKLANHPDPFASHEVKDLLVRARKAVLKGGWRPRKKDATHREILEPMLETCGDDLGGVRDRALILFGFATGGRRRSEISEAIVERLQPMGSNFLYQLGLTKTTQTGDAGAKPLKGKAAEAMRNWLMMSEIEEGPIFRSVDRFGRIGAPLKPKAVWKIIRKRAKLAGHDPKRFGAHSLRSGFMTESGIQGVPIADAMALSTHRSIDIALGYYQAGEGLRNRSSDLLG